MVVSKHSDQRVLETVMNAGDHDVVFVESLAHAYSQIKRILPNLVIVCLEIDDVDGFQVLSMLKLDRVTSRIPLVTYTSTPQTSRFNEDSARDYVCRESVARPMH